MQGQVLFGRFSLRWTIATGFSLEALDLVAPVRPAFAARAQRDREDFFDALELAKLFFYFEQAPLDECFDFIAGGTVGVRQREHLANIFEPKAGRLSGADEPQALACAR